jgi:YaiO family outer membrane protein
MEVTAEREKAEISRKIKKADALLAAGDTPEADDFLASLCGTRETFYEGCRRSAALAARSGNHERSALLYGRLAAAYPAEPDFRLLQAHELVHVQKQGEAAAVLDSYPDQSNIDLLTLRGDIAFYRKEYDQAISFYSGVVPVSKNPESARHLYEARTAKALDVTDRLLADKKYGEAEAIVSELYKNNSDRYSSGLMLGKVFIARKAYRDAAALYRELEQLYPQEPDLTALRIEALLLAGENNEAADTLNAAPPALQEYLAQKREDLLYRSADNWLKVSGAYYNQTGRSSTRETDLSLAVAQRIKQYSLTVWAVSTSKYSLSDKQIGLGLAGGRGMESPFLWEVTFALSPEAVILPRTTAGIEVTRGFSGFDASIGYTRMDFRKSSANIVIPGILWYIPATSFTLSERIYFVPDSGGYSSLTTLTYKPDHRFQSFASIGAGTSAERISTSQDYQRQQTLSARIGTEYRFTPHYSIGAETSYEKRGNLYDRTGAALQMRYWWQ